MDLWNPKRTRRENAENIQIRKKYHQMTKKKIVIFVSVVIPLTSQIYPSNNNAKKKIQWKCGTIV